MRQIIIPEAINHSLMAKYPIEIADLRSEQHPDLLVAIAEANRLQHSFVFSFVEDEVSQVLNTGDYSNIDGHQFLEEIDALRTSWGGFYPFLICIIDGVLQGDNVHPKISARIGERGISIITSNGVCPETIQRDKMVAFYLFEFAMHTIAFLVKGFEHHKENRGCVFDQKESFETLKICIQKGKFCAQCLRSLREQHERIMNDARICSIKALFNRAKDLLEHVPDSSSSKHQPRVFVGSSAQGLNIARKIQGNLNREGFWVEIWNQNTVFGVGVTIISALVEALKVYDYGIFVFTPDDAVARGSKEVFAPRDNVIFEAGLFIGGKGMSNTYIVRPSNRNIQFPSDLNGVIYAEYDPDSPNLHAALGDACEIIREAIFQAEQANEKQRLTHSE